MAESEGAVHIFVTVGSTKFTHLVAAVLSKPVVDAIGAAAKLEAGAQGRGKLHNLPSVKVTVQYGATPLEDVLAEEGSALVQQSSSIASEASLALSGASLVTSKEHARPASQEGHEIGVTNDIADSDNEDEAADADYDALTEAELSKTFRLNSRSKYDIDPDDNLVLGKRGLADASAESKPAPSLTSPGKLVFRVQTGAGVLVVLELIDYVSSIRPYLESASIVISHAGSGTILEALRLEKPPKLVVVPNETLMDNHQAELALALAKQRYLLATRVGAPGTSNQLPALLTALLTPSLQKAQSSSDAGKSIVTVPFPSFVPGRFLSLMDEQMGFDAPVTDDDAVATTPTSFFYIVFLFLRDIFSRLISRIAEQVMAVPHERIVSPAEQEQDQSAKPMLLRRRRLRSSRSAALGSSLSRQRHD